MTSLASLRVGIPDALPSHPGRDEGVPHAPRRAVVLTPAERERALSNVLRYFPAAQHEALCAEFAEELDRFGHIYCYRFRPVEYKMAAYSIDKYPAKCRQAASIMLMIMNNLDDRVAQYPHELVTYGGNGSVFSNWAQYRLTMRYLSEMTEHQTLVIYSGHPLGLFPSHPDAPRAVITNGMVVPNYSSRAHLEKMYATCVTQYGQMTAGSYCYIGPQGIVHGTTLSLLNAARMWLGERVAERGMKGVVYVSSGLGGMSGAQPKAARIAGCVGVIAEVDAAALFKRHSQGWVDEIIDAIPTLLSRLRELRLSGESVSIGYHGNVVTLWEALAAEEDEMLVDLGSDQTSLHNPFGGGYTPVALTYDEGRKLLADEPGRFKALVQASLVRQVTALRKLAARGLRFWDYGNAFLVEAHRAGADVLDDASARAGLTPDAGGTFRWPTYFQAFMGDIFSLGFGPFRWVCTSGAPSDLQRTDEIASRVLRQLMSRARTEAAGQYADNLKWIEEAFKHQMVVGSQARILYSDCEGRAALAAAFNEAIASGELTAAVVLSRDHHDVSGTDSPFRETSNVYDGSAFTADMAVQNAMGDAARGATWVALHNGGGVGWGEVINGGFGLVLDGTADAARRAQSMLTWDVSNGLARRSWAGNANAQLTIRDEMRRQQGLVVTLPTPAAAELLQRAAVAAAPPSNSTELEVVAAAAHKEPLGAAVDVGLSLVLLNCRVATMREGADTPYGLIDDGAIVITVAGRIAYVGPASGVHAVQGYVEGTTPTRDLHGALVTPGLIDCHTHLVYGGDRSEEWEMKLDGASYEEIARAGGGILNTVRHTRSATAEELAALASPRIEQLMNEGVTSIEIKSGYGLDVETERKQLVAAEQASNQHGFKVTRTFLGAHAVPPEYDGRPDKYISEVVLPAMETLHAEGRIDAVDAFCEAIAFDDKQTRRIFEHASRLGLGCRLHGDQLSDGKGGELAAKCGALSCDHCEHMTRQGVDAMGAAGVVAVLLPASSLFMNEATIPPVDAFREANVRMAIATNCNPGSAPCASLLLALHLACSRFRMRPEEALAGVTRHAAAAIGKLQHVGTLEIGKAADLAVWQCDHPRELAYHMGANPLIASFIDGKERPRGGGGGRLGLGLSAPLQQPEQPPPRSPLPSEEGEEGEEKEADARLGSLIRWVGPHAACPRASATTNNKQHIAIIGCPFDEGCLRNGGRAGAKQGPAAFRAAVRRVGVAAHPILGRELHLSHHLDLIDLGDIAAPAHDLEAAHTALRTRVLEALRAGFTPWVIGGGNDQSYPNARAMLDALAAEGTSLDAARVVNIDAHLDVRPLKKGGGGGLVIAHSGSPFRQLLDDPDWRGSFLELGAQPLQCNAAHAQFITERGGEIEWFESGAAAAAARAAKLEGFLRGGRSMELPPPMGSSTGTCLDAPLHGEGPPHVFFSFDLDAIQGSDMPSVSCPSPVGLAAEEAMRHCESAGASPNVRVVDMSELNPMVGDAFRSVRLSAMMFYHFCLGRAKVNARLAAP